MTGLIIAIVITGSLAIAVGAGAFFVPSYKTDWPFIMGAAAALLLFATIILGGAIGVVSQDNHMEEGIRICDEKGGVVTKDNHCFVDNEPVEFKDGDWTW